MLTKSVNYWSAPGGLAGTLTPGDFMQLAKASGYHAVELAVGDVGSAFPVDATQAFCEDVVAESQTIGIPILSLASGLYWSRNLGDADAQSRAQAQHDLERKLHIAAWMNVKTLLTIPGAVDVFFLPDRAPVPFQHVWHHASEGIRSLVPLAESLGVCMGIENVWNKFLMSPHDMASFVDQFESQCVGVYLDVANLLPFGYAEDWVNYLGHRIRGIHFKDWRRGVGTAEGFVDLLEGDVNWPNLMAAIRSIGYVGPVVAELIPNYRFEPIVRLQNNSNAMDKILAMA